MRDERPGPEIRRDFVFVNTDVLREKIDHLPTTAGIYLFKDAEGRILYVGKAADIKKRVRSYFRTGGGRDLKTLLMLEKAADIGYVITGSEKEAFILEDNLIKEYHPRYNIKFRDDKHYPLLKLSVTDEFPVLSIVRRMDNDGSVYFGPYPSAHSLRETVKWIRRIFPIRTSLDTKFSRLPSCGPSGTDPETCRPDAGRYRETVRQVRMFLEGRNESLLEELRKNMAAEAEHLNFEAAAKIRNQIEHIRRVIERQSMFSRGSLDQDAIGLFQNGSFSFYVLFIRRGKLLGGQGFTIAAPELSTEEALSSFIHQYYEEGRYIPREILIPLPLPDRNALQQWLSGAGQKKVNIVVPRKGEKTHLLDTARKNAERFIQAETGMSGAAGLLRSLKDELHLTRIPRRIEAFDISNLQGENAVGSMVHFADGKPVRERYRHFKIRTISGADDPGMMAEVLLRRYEKAAAERDLPDLVLLDGGRGQLNAGSEVFRRLEIRDVDLLSLAKERVRGEDSVAGENTEEKIFHPQRKEPIILARHSPLRNFLDRIRDEAHRFAISFHKKIRTKQAIVSRLAEIPDVGRVRQKALLEFFGSVERIQEAREEELTRAPKMNRKSAHAVYDFFHSPGEPSAM